MPIWSEVLNEIAEAQRKGSSTPFDDVRRRYLVELRRHTGRNTILYASGWLQSEQYNPDDVLIADGDIQALMQVINGLDGKDLDFILHSPGGSPETAEAVVSYLRSRFDHIRVIVPNFAMSAATMIACAADEIVLGKHSFLGPTDPQMVIPDSSGLKMLPAQAILDQFDKAEQECEDPKKLRVWEPMLANQYGPGLLVQCENALKMSRHLVEDWLNTWMFKDISNKAERARDISAWLADHQEFWSHSRHIDRSELEKKGLKIYRLEEDEKLQDLALSVFHATTHLFIGMPCVKIVESHKGRAFMRQTAI